jgi:hypothetical protein
MGLDEGAGALLRAYNERPTRAEPLYELARQYRLAGMNRLAWMFADAASKIPKPADILFVEDNVYSHGIDEELSISAYYTGEHERGMAACERLLSNPRANHALAKQNQTFYTQTLNGERFSLDALVPKELRTFDGIPYWCSNPSICDGLINVRLVNYQQERGKRYWGHPDAGIIRTKNAIVAPDFSCSILDDSILNDWNQDTRIFGLEDLRLVWFRDALWFSATCCQVPGANGNPQVVIGRIARDLSRVEHLVPLRWPAAQAVEKNWLLWPNDDELSCVYAFDPFTVLTGINTETGDVLTSSNNPTRWFPGRFRGSAAPLKSGLALVHDVANFEDRNIYTHRFIQLDPRDGITAYSDPFFLEHVGIEYACGMSITGTTLSITYGLEDREAKMIQLPLEHALSMLNQPTG